MNYETLLLNVDDKTAIISLNRPDKLNALNALLLEELSAALAHVASQADIRSLIITGSGTKAFAAGADIAELHTCDAASGLAFAQKGQAVFTTIENFPIPVIAAVNGFALGGGCELALACHVRFASTNAKFGQPEVKLGIIPGYGGTQRLTRLCGSAVAVELICGGGMINAERALNIGLVNSVVAPEELMNTATALATSINEMAPLAVRSSLDCIRNAARLHPNEGMAFEATEFARICGTADFKEGTAAFLEKRAAQFQAA